MNPSTISKEFYFSAAHRLEGHPKCGRLHGHNYKVVVEISGTPSIDTGMVLDFGRLSTIVDPLIDRFDHRYIVSFDNSINNDPYIRAANGSEYSDHLCVPGIPFSTAECLGLWFQQEIMRQVGGGFYVAVTVYETDKCKARTTQ